jgi:N-acyl-L-homoserine lactone synthetase
MSSFALVRFHVDRDDSHSRSVSRAADKVPAAPRLHMTRLDAPATAELIAAYLAGARLKDLAGLFGVHRTTVSSILARHGVELRPVGMSLDQVDHAARLYREGWSLARIGEKVGVDDMTVRRYLLLAGVVMRSSHERRHGRGC